MGKGDKGRRKKEEEWAWEHSNDDRDEGDWYLGALAVLQDGFVRLLGGKEAGASSVQVLKHTHNHYTLSLLLLQRT